MSQPRVFVSHSSKDTAFARRLAADLRRAGADAWIYEADESAGNIMERVDQMLAQCEWLVLVLSPDALASKYVRTEVFVALNLMQQGRMRGVVPIVARTIDAKTLPPMWAALRRFDAVGNEYAAGARGVLAALDLPTSDIVDNPGAQPDSSVLPARLAQLGFVARRAGAVEYIVPPLCEVPAGEFLMGSDPTKDREAYDDEKPQHCVNLPTFQIARYPVTVAEYACFVRAGGKEPEAGILRPISWQDQLKRPDHPVVCVSWHDATAYAAWLARLSGQPWRLPTEAEWEKAARGSDGRIYPWGDEFDTTRCNTSESGIRATTSVGTYSQGASPCGAQDMAGNAWEWTSSLLSLYPNSSGESSERAGSTDNRVLRGGSWYDSARNGRAACRDHCRPDFLYDISGFRVVCVVPSL